MEAYSAIIESKTDATDDGSMPKRELPLLTHGGNAELLSNELDYEEMVILSGLFRRWALYNTTYSPDFRTELIGYSADFEQLAQWAGERWRAADPSGALPVSQMLIKRARKRRSVIKLEHAKHWLGRALPQYDLLLNGVAWQWLEEANVQSDHRSLHLLTLARWGFENGAEGDWGEDLRHVVEIKLEGLALSNADDLMWWLFANDEEGDPKEQKQQLLHLLKKANGPLQAAEFVLCTIFLMMLHEGA